MAQFSTHEAISLEKQIIINRKLIENVPENIEFIYEIQRCFNWIKTNNFQKVCLQFPDFLLPDSSQVALKLQQILQQTVYILGDTAYESCCVDYVAASHIKADAVIHFGPVCFSQTSATIPFLNIYEKFALDVEQLEECFLKEFKEIYTDNGEIVILLDTQYIHIYGKICEGFSKYTNVSIQTVDNDNLSLLNKIVIFLGENSRKLLNIQFTFKPKLLFYYTNNKIISYDFDNKILKRRYYLSEKIKDSKTVGIVIGTLAIKNYLLIIERLKKLLQLHQKKYYLISVGKPAVAKLANFPEIDVYVLITCQMNEIYDNYKDFYKPILTPFDIEIALNPNSAALSFTYDYNILLTNTDSIENLEINKETVDVSLLTGNLRQIEQIEDNYNEKSQQIALKIDGTVALNTNYGAGFLAERSWKGLEQNLGESEVRLVEEGRTGLAECYGNEMLQ